jgi:hypothetical protein
MLLLLARGLQAQGYAQQSSRALEHAYSLCMNHLRHGDVNNNQLTRVRRLTDEVAVPRRRSTGLGLGFSVHRIVRFAD